jgi:hypothetical protein
VIWDIASDDMSGPSTLGSLDVDEPSKDVGSWLESHRPSR